jgi:hypothetical protein
MKPCYPYSYGDKGPEISLFENKRALKVLSFALLPTVLYASPAFAVDDALIYAGGKLMSKAALESVRTAACASAGACIAMAQQNAKCGNMSAAGAFLCGAAISTCIEAATKLAVAKSL